MNAQLKNVLGVIVFTLLALPTLAQHKIAMTSGMLELKELTNVAVEGYSGNEVVIETAGSYKIPERAKGLKPVNGMGLTDNTGIGLSVKDEGKDRKVVQQVARNNDAKYLIKVPKGVKVKYVNSSIHGDDFQAKNIAGEMEVQTLGGDIKMIDVTGPMTVNSVHGNVDVVFTNVFQDLPSSIATVHGDLDVTLPKSTNANLSLATNWGEVYSDLDIKVENADGMKVYGDKKISGKLGSGGVNLSLSATHGNVYLRGK
ncbi:DUF4097 family beta strand repeat protein [Fulvivirga sp. 29W222]|uniref:DUF4097 family beta strand repeat protein n=1 Tax=Fulvivirga marina TaxID=2494733 RepID=A0A937FYG9_9BACT|nr:DUF4097 family beta strand repeat-containing protein [Fulvivirga marina]MBL6447313.1 DUF4097 family beta strand repeat protein [Fulvivirga marina]